MTLQNTLMLPFKLNICYCWIFLIYSFCWRFVYNWFISSTCWLSLFLYFWFSCSILAKYSLYFSISANFYWNSAWVLDSSIFLCSSSIFNSCNSFSAFSFWVFKSICYSSDWVGRPFESICINFYSSCFKVPKLVSGLDSLDLWSSRFCS